MGEYRTLDRRALERKLETERPDPDDPRQGFALVNVLEGDAFEQEHIPGSIHIPAGREDAFEARFEPDKEIVVYCASTDCDASPKVAAELARRGFRNVEDYEGGMADWKAAGHPVARGADGGAA